MMTSMPVTAFITGVYAVMLIAGGISASIKAGSKPSLYAGVTAGLLELLAVILLAMQVRAGLYLAFIVAIVLAIWAGKSWIIDRKPLMPRGVLFLASLIEIITCAIEFYVSPVA